MNHSSNPQTVSDDAQTWRRFEEMRERWPACYGKEEGVLAPLFWLHGPISTQVLTADIINSTYEQWKAL